jgi:serine/threonine protein kinase
MSRSTTKRGVIPETSATHSTAAAIPTNCRQSPLIAKGTLKEFKKFPSGKTADVQIVALAGYPKEPLFVVKTYKIGSSSQFASHENGMLVEKKYSREHDVLRRSVHPNVVKLYSMPRDHSVVARSSSLLQVDESLSSSSHSPPQHAVGTLTSVGGSPPVATGSEGSLSFSSARTSSGSATSRNKPRPIYLELMDLGSLKDVCTKLRRRPGMTKELLCEYAKAVAVPCLLGLQYLHSQTVTHRDIKPENILLSKAGRVKWCDFDSCSPEIAQTVGVGTNGYEAPEILLNSGNTYTDKVDLWSLGCVLYWIVNDCTPAELSDLTFLLHKLRVDPDWQFRECFHLAEKVPDEPLRDLIFHLLETNPQDRYNAFDALKHRALSPKLYNGAFRGGDQPAQYNQAVEQFRNHGIVIAGENITEKSELEHIVRHLVKNEELMVSKEAQSSLQEKYKQLVYSRQKPAVEFLSAFYARWADDSFLMVSVEDQTAWKKITADIAASANAPAPSSFSSDGTNQAPSLLTPVSPPEGSGAAEFTRHLTTDDVPSTSV